MVNGLVQNECSCGGACKSRRSDNEHLGFEKLEGELDRKGVDDPAALAASIGRKKYGAKGMAKKARAGMTENQCLVALDTFVANANPKGINQYTAGQTARFNGKAADHSVEGTMDVKIIDPHSNAHEVAFEKHGRQYDKNGYSHLATATVERPEQKRLSGEIRPAKRFEAYHHTLSPTTNAFDRDSGGRFSAAEEEQMGLDADREEAAKETEAKAKGIKRKAYSVGEGEARPMAKNSARGVWNKLFDFLTGNARRHPHTGRFIEPGAGVGKGEVHDAAVGSAARRNDADPDEDDDEDDSELEPTGNANPTGVNQYTGAARSASTASKAAEKATNHARENKTPENLEAAHDLHGKAADAHAAARDLASTNKNVDKHQDAMESHKEMMGHLFRGETPGTHNAAQARDPSAPSRPVGRPGDKNFTGTDVDEVTRRKPIPVPDAGGSDGTEDDGEITNRRRTVAKPTTLRTITGNADDDDECPECGGDMVDGVCEKCGYEEGDETENANPEGHNQYSGGGGGKEASSKALRMSSALEDKAGGGTSGEHIEAARAHAEAAKYHAGQGNHAKAADHLKFVSDHLGASQGTHNRRKLATNAFPPSPQHAASREAAGASVMTEHPEARDRGLQAMDTSGDGDSPGAADHHLATAKIHDRAATQARKDDDEAGAGQHDQAAMLHRRAASVHKADPMDQDDMAQNRKWAKAEKRETTNRSSAARSSAGTTNRGGTNMDRNITINGVTKRESQWASDAVVANAARAGFKLGSGNYVYNDQGKLVKNDGGPASADAGRSSTVQANDGDGSEDTEEVDSDSDNNMFPSRRGKGLTGGGVKTMNQWRKTAPPEVLEIVDNALANRGNLRTRLIAQLTANAEGDRKQRLTANFQAMKTEVLQDLVAAMPTANHHVGMPEVDSGDLNFLGGAGGPLTNASGAADDQSDCLVPPTLNYQEMAAERQARTA